MTILLLFNKFNSMKVEEILDITQINVDLCTQSLWSLLKGSILTCSEINTETLSGDSDASHIKSHYSFQVNESFKKFDRSFII